MEKICNFCKELKPLTEYTKNVYSKDGLHSHCRTCKKSRQDPIKHKIANEKWRENNRVKIREKSKAEYARNKERHSAKTKAKYFKTKKENPEKLKAWSQRFYNSPKGVYAIYKKQAEKRGYAFELELSVFKKHWNAECFYCGANMAKVGFDRRDNSIGYNIDNIVPCCGICNTMKMDSTIEDFIAKCKSIASRF